MQGCDLRILDFIVQLESSLRRGCESWSVLSPQDVIYPLGAWFVPLYPCLSSNVESFGNSYGRKIILGRMTGLFII